MPEPVMPHLWVHDPHDTLDADVLYSDDEGLRAHTAPRTAPRSNFPRAAIVLIGLCIFFSSLYGVHKRPKSYTVKVVLYLLMFLGAVVFVCGVVGKKKKQ